MEDPTSTAGRLTLKVFELSNGDFYAARNREEIEHELSLWSASAPAIVRELTEEEAHNTEVEWDDENDPHGYVDRWGWEVLEEYAALVAEGKTETPFVIWSYNHIR
jgi:hypothetical protein